MVNLSTDDTFDCQVINVSGRGMQVRLPKRMPVNTPVRIDYADALLLGDICYCNEQGGTIVCGIILAHSLVGTAALTALMTRVSPDLRTADVKTTG